LNERNETRHLVETLRAVAAEVRETNAALLNARQNEIMKTLTIMAFTTFPLSLIASIFGMNTDYLPIVGTPGDFWIVMGIMIALTASFFVYFRAKHWI
jgi:Mg2+ and Co2+ transporter CorA